MDKRSAVKEIKRAKCIHRACDTSSHCSPNPLVKHGLFSRRNKEEDIFGKYLQFRRLLFQTYRATIDVT